MSHEVIFDKSYFKEDKSMKSFDMTDSLISGICSNSSRPEESDKSSSTNNKSRSITNYESESTESNSTNEGKFQVSNNDTQSFNDKFSSLSKKSISTNESQYTDNFKQSNTNDSPSFSDESPSSDNFKLTNNKISNKKSVKKSSSYRSRSTDKSTRFHTANILPSRAEPFVYDRKTKTIRYNFERCVSTDSSVIFGGNKGNFIFDPSNQTLTIGLNNELNNCSNSSAINCSGVKLKNCKETVALGIKATEDDEVLEDLNQTVLVRNLHVAGSLYATNIRQNSIYVVGNSTRDIYHQIVRGDGVDIIYVNSVDGIIWIQLGTSNNTEFEANRIITIKDVTLETNQSTSYNVNIIVPPAQIGSLQTRIEYYNGKNLAVSSDKLTGYVLNTAGGSVTYRYVEPFMPGQSATWIIQNQFLGNIRTNQFRETDSETRSKLIRKY